MGKKKQTNNKNQLDFDLTKLSLEELQAVGSLLQSFQDEDSDSTPEEDTPSADDTFPTEDDLPPVEIPIEIPLKKKRRRRRKRKNAIDNDGDDGYNEDVVETRQRPVGQIREKKQTRGRRRNRQGSSESGQDHCEGQAASRQNVNRSKKRPNLFMQDDFLNGLNKKGCKEDSKIDKQLNNGNIPTARDRAADLVEVDCVYCGSWWTVSSSQVGREGRYVCNKCALNR